MENEYYVYAWYFISTGEIFHIGKGKGNRCFDTIHSRNSYFKNIISAHKDDVAVKKLYENITNETACELERKLIKEYKSVGQCKTNFHEGGCGGNTGNYDNIERSKKLSKFAKSRVGVLNPNFGKVKSSETKRIISNKIKNIWEDEPDRFITENRKNCGFKKGNIPWNVGKHYNKSKLTPKQYLNMMLSDCKYKYEIYYDNKLIYWCLGHSKLFSFCKETFDISRAIVEQIIQEKWIPKFNKHKYLSPIKIIKIDRSVTTNCDECNSVEWRLQPFEVQGNLKG